MMSLAYTCFGSVIIICRSASNHESGMRTSPFPSPQVSDLTWAPRIDRELMLLKLAVPPEQRAEVSSGTKGGGKEGHGIVVEQAAQVNRIVAEW